MHIVQSGQIVYSINVYEIQIENLKENKSIIQIKLRGSFREKIIITIR